MNIEESVIKYLSDKGFFVYADVPEDRPDNFITVERTGGASDGYLDTPTIAIQSWSTSRYNASKLAKNVDTVMLLAFADENDDVAECERMSLMNYPDEAQPRYQAVYNLITY